MPLVLCFFTFPAQIGKWLGTVESRSFDVGGVVFWSILLLIMGVWAIAATFNAFRPLRNDWLLLPSMLWSWVVIELPAQHVLVQMALTAVLAWLGAFDSPIGWVGLALLVVSWVGGVVLTAQSRGARGVVERTLATAGIQPSGSDVPAWRVVAAFPYRGRSVERLRDIPFRRVAGRVLKLDIYRSRRGGPSRPILLYLHGGAWIVGDKREQGLPLMHHLARNGWLCVSANYRLSPGATFPDHLVDAKAALVWIREHAAEYGGDSSFIAVAGGSAGGHLASLVALTAGDPRYQPGFEAANTSVDAAVPLYGVYDLTNRLRVQSSKFVPLLMEPMVMKAFLAEDPEKYRAGSPIDQVHPGAPPFLVVQGDQDTLAPAVETRAFVDRLRETSDAPVVYLELPRAQHAFDLFYSYRCARMIEGATAFLNDELSRHHHEAAQ